MSRMSSARMAGNLVTALLLLVFSINPDVSTAQDEGPKDFRYVHLWASHDGVTHIDKHCRIQNFTLMPYAAAPQYVKSDFGGLPTKMVFTELPVGFTEDLHSPPSVQFVVDLHGSWYIKTTDGSEYKFKPGEVLFQDNTATSPALHVPQHYTGTVGKKPCQQMVVQLNRTAEVDNPCPF